MSKRGFTVSKQKLQQKTAAKSAQKHTTETSFKPTPTLQLIRPALMLFRQNFAVIAFIIIIPTMLSTLGQALMGDFMSSLTPKPSGTLPIINGSVIFGGILIGLSIILALINTPATYYVQLQTVYGKRPGIIECYRQSLRFLPRLYGLSLLLACLIVSTAVLIFPVFIFIRRYFLASYFLVDGDTGIRTAMQRSAAATKPYRGYVWATLLLAIVAGGAGFGLATVVKPYGALLIAPLSCVLLLVIALRYKELAEHQKKQSGLTIED